jgi:small ligand-binding sensory domain FIST
MGRQAGASGFRFGSALSNAEDLRAAIGETAEKALAALGGDPPDLAVVFTTPHHTQAEEDVGRLVRARVKARTLVGVTAAGVIGGGRESEERPGLSVFLARLPGVDVRPFALPPQESAEAPRDLWRSSWPVRAGERASALLFADPFSVEIMAVLDLANEEWPGLPVMGGVASGGTRPGVNRLYVQDETLAGGAVGAILAGPIEVRAVVSQGCRPIGRHLVITKASGNVIREIGGKPALAVLREVIGALDERDQSLAARALHVGRAIDERRDSFRRGDFLIRNPLGVDPESGALAVGDTFRTGQTIQLHVRDAASAGEDLRHLLEEERGRAAPLAESGALLFQCNGRGRRFFGVEDHDTSVMREVLGDVPIAGFFCGGEFGPVGGRNFIHGYTSSIALLGPASGAPGAAPAAP